MLKLFYFLRRAHCPVNNFFATGPHRSLILRGHKARRKDCEQKDGFLASIPVAQLGKV